MRGRSNCTKTYEISAWGSLYVGCHCLRGMRFCRTATIRSVVVCDEHKRHGFFCSRSQHILLGLPEPMFGGLVLTVTSSPVHAIVTLVKPMPRHCHSLHCRQWDIHQWDFFTLSSAARKASVTIMSYLFVSISYLCSKTLLQIKLIFRTFIGAFTIICKTTFITFI